jgi:UDP-N-acetylglucosamine--N-acetylmuramyl-(pentapeptide) pyrophosphoryl-undecaprenol N-acetylglucosamine transferase
MDEVMKVSSLVVSRSGALTLTEISLLGKPAIFIPLPSSSANRQEDNARVFEKNGASKVILNSEINKENLSKAINEIINDKEKLKKMGDASKKMAVYNSEEKIYEEIKRLVG